MSVIGLAVPPIAASVVQNAQPAETHSENIPNNLGANTLNQSATVVSLSAESSKRVVGHGDGRSVDGTFENQESKTETEKKKEKQGSSLVHKSVNVTA